MILQLPDDFLHFAALAGGNREQRLVRLIEPESAENVTIQRQPVVVPLIRRLWFRWILRSIR